MDPRGELGDEPHIPPPLPLLHLTWEHEAAPQQDQGPHGGRWTRGAHAGNWELLSGPRGFDFLQMCPIDHVPWGCTSHAPGQRLQHPKYYKHTCTHTNVLKNTRCFFTFGTFSAIIYFVAACITASVCSHSGSPVKCMFHILTVLTPISLTLSSPFSVLHVSVFPSGQLLLIHLLVHCYHFSCV